MIFKHVSPTCWNALGYSNIASNVTLNAQVSVKFRFYKYAYITASIRPIKIENDFIFGHQHVASLRCYTISRYLVGKCVTCLIEYI